MIPFDFTKVQRDVSKKLGIQTGFHDPKVWIDTGSFLLNYLISGHFKKGVPLSKVTVLAGESGSGKSYIASGNLVRNAQKMGIMPIILDSEFALDEDWLQRLGVDTSPDKLLRFPVAMVDDCATIIYQYMEAYRAAYDKVPREQHQKILFIIDSIGMLSTPTEVDQFKAGEMKGDMGRKAKQLKAFVTQCLKLFGPYDVGLVATNHTYKSQDQWNPDDVISGGSGFIYASSIIVAMNKLKLKEDEDGQKLEAGKVAGIRSKVRVVKSRYAKPFETGELRIPYSTGLNPYSGLIDFFEEKGVLVKDGNRLKYVARDGSEHKHFRKQIENSLLDRIMDEWDYTGPVGVDETPEDEREGVYES